MVSMAAQDIRSGGGVTFIDPHGGGIEALVRTIPRQRTNDVINFDVSDFEYPIGLNLLEVRDGEDKERVIEALLSALRHIWKASFGPRTEFILHNSISALTDIPGSSLVDLYMLLADTKFQRYVAPRVTDPATRLFWQTFLEYPQRFASEIVAAPLNKVGQLVMSRRLRNILGQRTSKINFKEVLDDRKILLVSLPKGIIGEQCSNLLGALIISRLYSAALERQHIPEESRADHVVYIDEFPSFTSESLPAILSETRKYHLFMTLGHQFLDQIPKHIQGSIFGNISSWFFFRIGMGDAQVLEKETLPQFKFEYLQGLANYHVVYKHLVNGHSTLPSVTATLPPVPLQGDEADPQTIILRSRQRYSRSRSQIEPKIDARLRMS